MLRTAPRHLLRCRPSSAPLRSRHPPSFPTQHRLASTSSPQKPRSWKSLFVRTGLAAGVVYFYNTSPIFAEGTEYAIPYLQTSPAKDESSFPVSSSLTTPRPATGPIPNLTSQPSISPDQAAPATSTPVSSARPWDSPSSLDAPSLEDTEEEAAQQGAFNEETGEINWDCPCLGGMAHGTCGEQFRAAFSCFVYSKEEPKGMDCIDKFKTMQNCFREHPEEYGADLDDEEDEGEIPDGESEHVGMGEEGASAAAATRQGAEEVGVPRYPSGEPMPEPARKGLQAAETQSSSTPALSSPSPPAATSATIPTTSASASQHSDPVSESEHLVPKAAHDARGSNQD